MKCAARSSKWRVELGVWEVIFSSYFRGNCLFFFGIARIWPMCHSLDKRVWLSIMFLPLKQSLTLLQIWISFIIPSPILPNLELSKLTPNILMEILIISFALVDQFYFYMHQPIRLDFLKSLSSSSMHRPIVLKSLVTGNIS